MTTSTTRWDYSVPAPHDQAARDAVFLHMREQGLLPVAMCAVAEPTLDHWRELTRPDKAWLLRAATPGGELLGAALFTPWRHRTWEFDFTVFRPHFPLALPLARGALAWLWEHAPCDSLMGLCPATHRHAWKLAEAAGFAVLGRLPGACLVASRGRYVDGVLVCARRFTSPRDEAMLFHS